MSTPIPTGDARVLSLARARQQLAHDGTGYVPAWEDLADAEREQALTAACGWLAAAIEAGLLSDVTDVGTSFVLDTALREFAHRQRGEADDVAADIAAGDNTERGAATEVDRRRRWAEIAESVLDQIDP